MRLKGYISIAFVCFFYWILDSIWSKLLLDYTLKKMIFSGQRSYLDTFLLRVSPHQMVSRLMVVCLFVILGSIIIEFMIKRQAVKKELMESEEKYRLIVENQNDLVVKFDSAERIVYASPSYCRTFGKDENELIGRDLKPLIHSEDIPRVQASLATLTEEPHVTRHEERVKTVEGWKCFSWSAKAVIHPDGKIKEIISVGRDITESKLAEELLKETEQVKSGLLEKLNEAQQIARIGSWEWNLQTNQVWWSDETYRIFGVKQEDYVPSFDANGKLIHPDDFERYVTSFNQSFQTGEPLDLDIRLICADGRLKHCNAKGQVVYDDSGRQIRFIGTIMDITGHKQAEAEKEMLQAQLNHVQKMESVGRLAGGVAHDFNNMLNVIIGNAELALEQVDPDSQLYVDLIEIQNAARRSADLTRQLLAFARKQTVTPRVLDLNQTVESMLNMLQRLIGEGIDLTWVPGADIWPVEVDPSQIDQVIVNLCVNARDAIPGTGKIMIKTTATTIDENQEKDPVGVIPGEYAVLSVSDTGCGMEEGVLAQLFEPFFTTKEFGKGTGLGLATVYGIVKQNKGFINVFSKPGQGTTFTIYLPRHLAGAADILQAPPMDATRRGQETILVVEDEPAILKLATRILKTQGYTVLSANSPGQAMQMAGEHTGKIHLLMTDVVMPEMNGRDLAKKLRSLYPYLKPLFMSGYTADVIAHQGVLDHDLYFLQKPFSGQDLAEKVREVLDEAKGATHA